MMKPKAVAMSAIQQAQNNLRSLAEFIGSLGQYLEKSAVWRPLPSGAQLDVEYNRRTARVNRGDLGVWGKILRCRRRFRNSRLGRVESNVLQAAKQCYRGHLRSKKRAT